MLCGQEAKIKIQCKYRPRRSKDNPKQAMSELKNTINRTNVKKGARKETFYQLQGLVIEIIHNETQ